MIKLKNINKFYTTPRDKFQVLHNLDLDINKGEFIALTGSSGSGKSTLLNIVGLLDNEFSGYYYFDGIDILTATELEMARIRNTKIGFVFQSFSLLNQYPLWYNVAMPLQYRQVVPDNIKEQAYESLRQVDMLDYAERYPNEVSGGQQQRVAIARSLIIQPDLILADEPTGALDTVNSRMIIDLFIKLNNERETAILLVTHDMSIANMASSKLVISDGNINFT